MFFPIISRNRNPTTLFLSDYKIILCCLRTGQVILINVIGSSTGQNPTPAEEEQLHRICLDTVRAIEAASNRPPLTPTNAPTLAPTALPTRALVPTSAPTLPRIQPSMKGMIQGMMGMNKMSVKMGPGSDKANGKGKAMMNVNMKRGKIKGGSIAMPKSGMRGESMAMMVS
jgi:hypothetical protein